MCCRNLLRCQQKKPSVQRASVCHLTILMHQTIRIHRAFLWFFFRRISFPSYLLIFTDLSVSFLSLTIPHFHWNDSKLSKSHAHFRQLTIVIFVDGKFTIAHRIIFETKNNLKRMKQIWMLVTIRWTWIGMLKYQTMILINIIASLDLWASFFCCLSSVTSSSNMKFWCISLFATLSYIWVICFAWHFFPRAHFPNGNDANDFMHKWDFTLCTRNGDERIILAISHTHTQQSFLLSTFLFVSFSLLLLSLFSRWFCIALFFVRLWF